MLLIKNNGFGVISEVTKALLVVWDIELKIEVDLWKKEISCLTEAVVIGLCRVLRGEEVLLTSMKEII